MVSADFIQAELKQLQDDPSIVHLELEDCLVTMTLPMIGPLLRDIPLRLKEILSKQDRPWKGIRIVDDLVNGWSYPEYLASRQQFLQVLHTICLQQRIPITFRTKIHLTDTDNPDYNSPTAADTKLVPLLRQFQNDPGMIRLDLTLNTTPTTCELLQTLTELLLVDKRPWEDVKIQLSTSQQQSSMTVELNQAMERLEQATRSQGVTGLC